MTDSIAQATGAAAKHYAHDAFGNRIWAGPSAYAGQPSHLYDQGNRLVEVRDPVTQAVLGQYTYDAMGRRVREVAGGTTTLYFYDAAGHLVEVRQGDARTGIGRMRRQSFRLRNAPVPLPSSSRPSTDCSPLFAHGLKSLSPRPPRR